MKKILGNYLTQANRDFPLDCETLDYLQSLTRFAEIIGNIGGDRIILLGCESANDNARRSEGYVFLKTKDHPEGEVMYWEGGSTSSGMYVKLEDVSVNANNNSYPKAYTRRWLAPGIGSENYKWEDFTEIKTIKDLISESNALRGEINALQQSPLGIINIWAGSKVPDGYLLCDGAQYRTDEYPELYAALGTSFNSALSANGSPYTTQSGYFRVPDLRGRFIVGLHDSDTDYRTPGQSGGVKTVTLTSDQMPNHSHTLKDYTIIPHGTGECTTGNWNVGGTNYQVGYDNLSGNPKRMQTASDKRDQIQWIKHPTDTAGSGMSHENRPPYYVMAYIMRAK